MTYGTSHFTSIGAAYRYYAPYGFNRAQVDNKLKSGEIHLGNPRVKPDEEYEVDGDGRYFIRPKSEQEYRMAREHYDKYESKAQRLGVDTLKRIVARVASSDRIETALSTGEGHLNEIPLQSWDAQHHTVLQLLHLADIQDRLGRGWSLCDTVCTLKHVAKYHVVGIEAPKEVI